MAKRQPKDGDCVRCGAESSWMVRDFAVTLSGSYKAYLCLDCCNDWDFFIVGHPVRIAFTENGDDLSMAFAMTCGDGIDRSEAVARLREVERELGTQLRDVAKTWTEQPIVREQASAH